MNKIQLVFIKKMAWREREEFGEQESERKIKENPPFCFS